MVDNKYNGDVNDQKKGENNFSDEGKERQRKEEMQEGGKRVGQKSADEQS